MKKSLVLRCALVLGVICVGIASLDPICAQKTQPELLQVISTSLPVEVLGTSFSDRDQIRSERTAKIFLRNNSDKTIIAYTVESGNEKDADRYSVVSISDETGPVAGPRADFTIEVLIGNFITGMPLRVNAIVFSDRSSAGETEAVRNLKKLVDKAFESKGRRVDPG